jgi:hypothetical protein
MAYGARLCSNEQWVQCRFSIIFLTKLLATPARKYQTHKGSPLRVALVHK